MTPRAWSSRRLSVLLAASWAMATAFHLLRVDWLSALVVLAALASLLRRRGVLDRILVALALLMGAGGAAGLLWSVWPWGLAPVAISGTALTALVVVAAATGRRPSLPAFRSSDLLPPLGALRFVLTAPALERTVRGIVQTNPAWRERVSIVHVPARQRG
jgi:hypothetical protein